MTIVDIRKTRLTPEQIKKLYDAITEKMISKNCYFCGKLGLEIEGMHRHVDGDMTKPRRFVCRRCL